MIEVEYPLVDVHPLPAWSGTVTQWRSSRGDETRAGYTTRSLRRHRLAWSAAEAADLAGIPVRTVHAWTNEDELAWPTFVEPDLGIEKRRWCAGDLVVLRMSYDLLKAGLSRSCVASCARSLSEVCGYYPRLERYPIGDLLLIGDRWFVASDTEMAAHMESILFASLCTLGCDFDPDDGDWVEEHPELRLLEYPMARRIGELSRRIGAWWAKVGTPIDRRPPWLT